MPLHSYHESLQNLSEPRTFLLMLVLLVRMLMLTTPLILLRKA